MTRSAGKVCGFLLSALLIMPSVVHAGIDPFSPADFADALKERQRENEYRARIEEFKREGGSKGAEGLRELLTSKKGVPYKSLFEAAAALGSLKRQEDSPFLFEWSTQRYPSKESQRYGPPVYEALAAVGMIGGGEACRLLTNFFAEKSKASGYDLQFNMSAKILLDSGCLSRTEVLDLARSISQDMWAERALNTSALQFLKEAGDQEAVKILESQDAAWREASQAMSKAGITIEKVREVIDNPSIAWWAKFQFISRIMRVVKGSQEDSINILVDIAKKVYAERPDHRSFNSYALTWIADLNQSGAQWIRTDGNVFLEERGQACRETLPEATCLKVDAFIGFLRRSYGYQQKRQQAALSQGKKAPESLPSARGEADRSEPIFISAGSRLRNAELFIYKGDVLQSGVVRMDFFLASVMKAISSNRIPVERNALEAIAMRSLVLEKELDGGPGRQGPLLMPLIAESGLASTEQEWDPRIGDFSIHYPFGEGRILLFRVIHDGPVSLWIRRSRIRDEREASFQFRSAGLSRGNWVIVPLAIRFSSAEVFVSEKGDALDHSFSLEPGVDESQRENAKGHKPVQSDTLQHFLSVRKVSEQFEKDSFDAAGGAGGIEEFRTQLLIKMKELQR